MKAGIVFFTNNGEEIKDRIYFQLKDMGYEISVKNREDNLDEWLNKNFYSLDALIFISATGIAVRKIAHFIKSKDKDPAVIVIDDRGNFAISLLSGHIGGANSLTLELSKRLDMIPVITTSTDINGKFAVDVWAKENNLIIKNIENIKLVSGALIDEKKVGIKSDIPIKVENKQIIEEVLPVGINITYKEIDKVFENELTLIPKRLVMGIGSRKNISKEVIEETVLNVLKENKICVEAIEKVCSIDLKKEEKGILEFCEKYKLPFYTFSADELRKVKGDFPTSSFVEKITGVSNVCQRAALRGTIEDNFEEKSENIEQGTIIVPKTCSNGVTVAIAVKEDLLYVK